MELYFIQLDKLLSEQKMPPEYANVMSHILCNDCEKKSDTVYHFMYHKCKHCGSYNTKLISTFSRQQIAA
jgi:ribosomal protein L37E